MRWRNTARPIFRILATTGIVVGITATLPLLHVTDRPLVTAVSFLLFTVVIASSAWGIRYAVLASFLGALGFSWLLPPMGRFTIEDPRDYLALATFLFVGLTTSYLSERTRKETARANQRGAEAIAAEQRFADLVNSVEGIVWEADAETFAFTFVSQQAERVLGYPAEQWLKEPAFWKDHLHPEDREWAVQFCRRATIEKSSRDFEYRMIADDGRVVWMRDLVTVVVENGRASRLRGVKVDVTRRRQDEEAIREQANLLSQTHDAIFVRDVNSTIKYWNRGAEELYGWTAEEAVGKVSHELVKTIFPISLQEIEAQLLHSGRWEGELVNRKKSGTPVIVASRWSLQRDEKGMPIAVLETNNDITDQKRAEEAVRRREKELQQVVATIPAWVFVAQPDGLIEFASEGWVEYSGMSAEQTSVGGWIATVHPDDVDLHLKKWHESLSSGEPFENEVRHRSKNGEYRWFLVRAVPLRDEHRNILKWYGTITDIQDRKQVEEQLRRSETCLAEAQRLTKTGSFIYDPRTMQASYLSEEWYRVYGFDPEIDARRWEQQHTSSEDLLQRIHPEDRNLFLKLLDEGFRRKRDHEGEFRVLLPNGATRHLYALAHPVLNSAGDLVQIMGSVTDITDRKRAEQERERLRQLEADLAHINRVSMMGELAASLGHEIKQPIAAAIINANTCLRWLKRDKPDLEEARGAAARMIAEARRLVEIINRTSSLYKKEATQRELVNMNELIEDIVGLLRNEARRHGVSIRTERPADLAKVTADRVQLQQVLMNLIINAIDATKTVSGQREITLSSEGDSSGQLLVSVSDTGVGLPPDVTQIFEAFVTTKAHGTGMGLAISRSIIESHGGRLSAKPNAGRGATFYFTLPLAAEAAAR
jgi:PAS domain S-box-containing protein